VEKHDVVVVNTTPAGVDDNMSLREGDATRVNRSNHLSEGFYPPYFNDSPASAKSVWVTSEKSPEMTRKTKKTFPCPAKCFLLGREM